jgi:capsular exopolysaccharide synthesis family protein
MKKAPAQLISTYSETSPFAEAYRLLRIGLLQRNGNPLWSLGITGANPQHGSTTTAANLSLIIAESGKRVVLVDADLYKPSLNRYFEISNDRGLTSVLEGKVKVDRALQVVPRQPSLAILPAGPEVRNPAALLQPDAVQALLDSLRGKSDFLIVDLPSVGAVAYTSLLAPFMDGLLLVVRAGTSPAAADQLIKQRLPGVNVVGMVLNQAPVNGKQAAQYYATASRSPSVKKK